MLFKQRLNFLLNKKWCILLALSLSAPSPALGQSSVPGGMQLLAGYRHEKIPSMESREGRVWKEGGPEITYEIGLQANYVVGRYKGPGQALWFKTQQTPEGPIEIAMTDEQTMVVGFRDYFANFVIHGIKSKADVAEVMLMLMTYHPIDGLSGK
jgi:hypothetical protein